MNPTHGVDSMKRLDAARALVLLALVGFGPILSSSCDKKSANDSPPEPKLTSSASASGTPAPAAALSASVAPLKLAPAAASARASDPTLCPSLCVHTARQRCGAGERECLTACEQMLDAPICTELIQAAYRCMAAQGNDAFECGDDGIAAIKDGLCDQEQGAVARCLRSSAIK